MPDNPEYYRDKRCNYCIKLWPVILLSVSAMKQSCRIGLHTVYLFSEMIQKCTFKPGMGICIKCTL